MIPEVAGIPPPPPEPPHASTGTFAMKPTSLATSLLLLACLGAPVQSQAPCDGSAASLEFASPTCNSTGGVSKGGCKCGAGDGRCRRCDFTPKWPGGAIHCGMPAPQYPVPFATPTPPTSYTYFSYPPLMPHHSLPHYRGTYSFRHGPGLSRTTVCWRPTKVKNLFARLHHVFELPR